MELKKKISQFRKFLVVGFLTNFLGFFIYALFTSKYFLFDPILVIIFLYPPIITIHFYLQKNYVFSITKFEFKYFNKYILNSLIFYLSNIILIFFAVRVLEINHLISQILIIIGLAILNFYSTKNFIFN